MAATPKANGNGDAPIVKVGHSAGNSGGNNPFAKDTKRTAPKPLSAK